MRGDFFRRKGAPSFNSYRRTGGRSVFYHGSAAAGIATLETRGEKHVVYLTDNRAYALFYLRDPQIDFVTCGVTRDGTVRY